MVIIVVTFRGLLAQGDIPLVALKEVKHHFSFETFRDIWQAAVALCVLFKVVPHTRQSFLELLPIKGDLFIFLLFEVEGDITQEVRRGGLQSHPAHVRQPLQSAVRQDGRRARA